MIPWFGVAWVLRSRGPLAQPTSLPMLDIPLDRDEFLGNLLRHLSGALVDVVALEEAAGFISLVGHEIGEQTGDIATRWLCASSQRSRPRLQRILVERGVNVVSVSCSASASRAFRSGEHEVKSATLKWRMKTDSR